MMRCPLCERFWQKSWQSFQINFVDLSRNCKSSFPIALRLWRAWNWTSSFILTHKSGSEWVRDRASKWASEQASKQVRQAEPTQTKVRVAHHLCPIQKLIRDHCALLALVGRWLYPYLSCQIFSHHKESCLSLHVSLSRDAPSFLGMNNNNIITM